MSREKFHQKLSPLVADRLPDFVQSEYPTFVLFLEKYYEWMDQEGYPTERTSNLLSLRDADDTDEEFIPRLASEYISSFPDNMTADKSLVIKNVNAFHKAKGTPAAFKYLFRILYGIDTLTVGNPWEKTVKMSSAVWKVDRSIKVSSEFGIDSWKLAIGSRITQAGNATASATIDAVRQYYDTGTLVTELILHDIRGGFNSTERITATFEGGGITKTVYGSPLRNVVASIKIDSAGTGYSVGDLLVFSGVCAGIGAGGYVSAIDSAGTIKSVTLNKTGYGYQYTPTVTVQSSSGTGSSLSTTIGPISTYPGYYLGDGGGFLSDPNSAILQDSDYWQKFAYSLNTQATDNVFVEDYKKAVKSTAHPAGMKMFGIVSTGVTTLATQNDTISTELDVDTEIPELSSSSSSG